MVTTPNRFTLEENGAIWDSLLMKRYTSLTEVSPILIELNNYVEDFELELSRQSIEIHDLIEALDQHQ